jgi:hypothetical protein
MAHKAPPIPPAQRVHPGEKPHIEGGHIERREDITGLQSGQPGDADANLKSQGRYGNRRQNVDTVHYKHQDR